MENVINTVKDSVIADNDLTKAVEDRFKHPVIGVFTTFSILINYELFFVFLFGDNLVARVEGVTMYINSGALNIIMPLKLTVAYIFIRFFLNILMRALDKIEENVGLNLADWTLNIVDHEGVLTKLKKSREDIRKLKTQVSELASSLHSSNVELQSVISMYSSLGNPIHHPFSNMPDRIKKEKSQVYEEIEDKLNGLADNLTRAGIELQKSYGVLPTSLRNKLK